MAQEYSKVLDYLNVSYSVKGRGQESARKFMAATGKQPELKWDGIFDFGVPQTAIVAVSEESILSTTQEIYARGIKKILLEKPGGPSISELREFYAANSGATQDFYVGYNRRHYSNVETLKEMIKEDGGVTSIHFDFSERSKQIAALKKAPGVKENWFLHNSTHVVNLVDFISGGMEIQISQVRGSLPWHPTGAQFSGSGITSSGGLVTYNSDWQAPANWAITVKTKSKKYHLGPLELLTVTDLDGHVEQIAEASGTSHEFKPGLLPMVQDFLSRKPSKTLIRFREQIELLALYERILGS